LIYGLSSLNFNHHCQTLEQEGKEINEKSMNIDIPEIEDDLALSNAINDSVSIFGWYIPWSAKRDSLHFIYETGKIGKTYQTRVDFETGQINITSKRGSLSHLLKGLHGLGEDIPNAPFWMGLWKYYQDLSVYSLVFWLISGIWLWFRKGSDHGWGNIIFYTFLTFSILIMLYIWLVG
jgi:hypothetical protein